MRFYRPRMSARDRFLTFKALDTSGAHMLRYFMHLTHAFNYNSVFCSYFTFTCLHSLQDFYKFYEVIGLKWKVIWIIFLSFLVALWFKIQCLNICYMCIFRQDAVENIGLMTFLTQPSSFSKVTSLFLFLFSVRKINLHSLFYFLTSFL